MKIVNYNQHANFTYTLEIDYCFTNIYEVLNWKHNTNMLQR